MTDQWEWWRLALAGQAPAIVADEPAAGFYETRSKNKATGQVTRGLVAYWYEPAEFETKGTAAKLYCKDGFGAAARMLDDLKARERWPYASKRPISRAVYDAVKDGKGWPDENEAARRDRVNSAAAPDADSFEAIRDRIEDLAREAERLIKSGAAKTKEESDQAADVADRLRKLEKRADELRDAEKRPHTEKANEAQRKWAPLVNRADDCKARLKKVVVTPFLNAEAARQAAAMAAAVKSGAAPEIVAPAKTTAGTTSTVALRTVTSAVIEDYAKALAYFADNAKVKDLIQQLANAAARQGTCPDGCRINTAKEAA
ncbi:hypothetical protein RA307_04930 [Xanthobacteraceae bacterium Astr-EGSB]|uniref:hypothetical protein n=1 Tax=Astrobacterium formosum TaxID=3069710 RepID=UPI0027B1D0EC|nr:hypothetical protein [Xanthobacteraceae bacterium Astr-EGSB]